MGGVNGWGQIFHRDTLVNNKDLTPLIVLPVDGKANSELIAILAKEYGIPKRDVEIVSGRNSKNKVVRLKRG